MSDRQFRALQVSEEGDGGYYRTVVSRALDQLPDNDVLIRVHYSSLNYKDALSATGHRGVTRHYPHTPGIDAAGVVESDRGESFTPGDRVIVIGYDLGMDTSGGFGQYVRVPAEWIVPLPAGLSLRDSMIYGTAGFTAAMALDRLNEHGVRPEDGEILVTGATGGVGSIGVALLAQAGYDVVAATGKEDQKGFLLELGATQVVSRDEVTKGHDRPLMSSRWAAAIDSVGGYMLDAALKSTQDGGAVAACGNVASGELNTTVFPFILRGVTLFGIDSAHFSLEQRRQLWSKIAGPWKIEALERLARERTLDQLDDEIDRILQGRQVGRVVVNLQ